MNNEQSKQETKPKVFLCYASENQDLMANFVRKFKHFNEELDVTFYDRIPSHPVLDATMHDRFIRFASTCNVAIILGSAPLALADSYANKHELPKLLERRRDGDVILVGVVLTRFKIEKFNIAGEIDFAQIFFSDFLKSRANHKNQDEYNKNLAVYNLIHKDEEDDYHLRLADWISELTSKTKEVLATTTSEKISNLIKSMRVKDLHLGELEQALRLRPEIWQSLDIPQPKDIYICYSWFFLVEIGKWYAQKCLYIGSLKEIEFDNFFPEIYAEVNSKSDTILDQIEAFLSHDLIIEIKEVSYCFEKCIEALTKYGSCSEVFQNSITQQIEHLVMQLNEKSKRAIESANLN